MECGCPTAEVGRGRTGFGNRNREVAGRNREVGRRDMKVARRNGGVMRPDTEVARRNTRVARSSREAVRRNTESARPNMESARWKWKPCRRNVKSGRREKMGSWGEPEVIRGQMPGNDPASGFRRLTTEGKTLAGDWSASCLLPPASCLRQNAIPFCTYRVLGLWLVDRLLAFENGLKPCVQKFEIGSAP